MNPIDNEIINKTKSNKGRKVKSFFACFPGYSNEEVLSELRLEKEFDQRIIELRYDLNDGHEITSTSEIAILLDLEESSVKSRIAYLKGKIIKNLEKKHAAQARDIQEVKLDAVNIVYTEEERYNACEALKLAIQYIRDGRYGDAEKFLFQALLTDERRTLQKAHLNLGIYYLNKGKPFISEEHLQKSLAIWPTDYFALLEMGKCLIAQNRYQEAIEYCDKSGIANLDYATKNAQKTTNGCNPLQTFDYMIEKGKCYAKMAQDDKALTCFDFAIKRKPLNYIYHLEKAKFLYTLKQFTAARKVIADCERLSNTSCQHKVILGMIEYLEGNLVEAKRLFDICATEEEQSDIKSSVVKIGYFFHELGIEDLAYEYYLKVPNFRKMLNFSNQEIENHIGRHLSNEDNETLHSIFNFPVSLNLLRDLISDMDKTLSVVRFDVYQIYCKDAGVLIVDENNQRAEDYITVLTLPFTKNIVLSYPDDKFMGANVTKKVYLEDLVIPPTPEVETVKEAEFVSLAEYAYQSEGTCDFSSDLFADSINGLADPEEKMYLQLRFGFSSIEKLKGKRYSEEEIGSFFGVSASDVHSVINRGLTRLVEQSNNITRNLDSIQRLLFTS